MKLPSGVTSQILSGLVRLRDKNVVHDLVSRISLGSFPFSIGRAKADPVEDGAAVLGSVGAGL